MEELSRVLGGIPKALVISTGFALVILLSILYALFDIPILLILFAIPILLVTLSTNSAIGSALSITATLGLLLADLSGSQAAARVGPALLNSFFGLLLFLGTVYVVQEYKKVLERERACSHEDVLTGIPNLRGFFELAQREIVRAKRKMTPISVAYLGLDNLNQVIEKRGKKAADAILQKLAQSLVINTRGTDVSARIGDTDFIILMSETGIEGGIKGIRRVNDLLLQVIEEYEMAVSFSIGLVTYNILPDSIDQMIAEASSLKNQNHTAGNDPIQHHIVDL